MTSSIGSIFDPLGLKPVPSQKTPEIPIRWIKNTAFLDPALFMKVLIDSIEDHSDKEESKTFALTLTGLRIGPQKHAIENFLEKPKIKNHLNMLTKKQKHALILSFVKLRKLNNSIQPRTQL